MVGSLADEFPFGARPIFKGELLVSACFSECRALGDEVECSHVKYGGVILEGHGIRIPKSFTNPKTNYGSQDF